MIPVYNEEMVLERAVEALRRTMETFGPDATRLPYEIILSENGSSDRTPEIGRALDERYPEVRFRSLGQPNYGRALRAAMLAARGRYVVCDEIDLCDVGFYRAALPRLESGEADLVVGSKVAPGARDQRPITRRLATRAITLLLRLLVGFRGTDTHGLKAFRREALLPTVRKCVIDKDLFASELVIRAGRDGHPVVEVPIEVRETRPTSIRLFRRVPKVLADLARLAIALQRRP